MLRMVIFLLMISNIVYAVNNDYIEPDSKLMNEQKINAKELLKQADSFSKNESLMEVISKSRNSLGLMKTEQKGQHFFNLPDKVNREDMKNYLNSAFQGGVDIKKEIDAPYSKKQPILLVSFSMPNKLLLSYLKEAKITGSLIAIRGLYKNDLTETVKKIASLVGDDKKLSGIMVDPSLFHRFEVESVPTFILPVDEIKQCTVNGCESPRHARATGHMSIKYFLEKVNLLGDETEKSLAKHWLNKYKIKQG